LFNPDPPAPDSAEERQATAVDYVSGIAMFSTGTLLALIRLYEPFFLYLLKKFIWMCFGQLLNKDPTGIKD